MKHILFLSLLVLAVYSIYIPLKANRARCLSEYLLGGAASSLKLKISFPKLENQQSGEHYTVSFRNTETQELITDIVHAGDKYSKQAELVKNVIYEVCLIFKSERDLQPLAEYTAESMFTHDQSQVAVPASLLTKDDLKGAFVSAAYLTQRMKEYTEEQKVRSKEESNAFLETEKLNKKLTILSGIEITVVICAGLYQFFTLKNYLSSRQHI